MFVTERALPVTDLARACEARGVESLWVPEHPIVPAQYETRYPLAEDGKMPRPHPELPDCFATLAAAAAVTQELRVATGICLVPERDPLHTALQVATLDLLSGGRFLFGVGAGWLREEMQLFAPHFPHRFAFLREAIAAMRKLWPRSARPSRAAGCGSRPSSAGRSPCRSPIRPSSSAAWGRTPASGSRPGATAGSPSASHPTTWPRHGARSAGAHSSTTATRRRSRSP